MKIFMVCDIYLDGRDAQTTHVWEICRNLSASNDVLLFTPTPRRRVIESKNIVYIPVITPFFKCTYYELVLLAFMLFYSLRRRPDVIYCRKSTLNFMHSVFSRVFRIPYILEVNGLVMDEVDVGGYVGLYKRLIKKIAYLNGRFDYRHAQKIVCVTRGVKDGVKSLYHIPDEKLVVIENGANTDIFRPLDKLEARRKLGVGPADSCICFVGSLVRWQGVEYLVRSAPLIIEQHPDARFFIIGDGPMGAQLRELAGDLKVRDHFMFTGVVPYEEVPGWIGASDLCVAYKTPLKSGYSPLKLYEYIACGRPVISADVPGIKELVTESRTGICVPPDNTVELAGAINSLLSDDAARLRMGLNGRDFIVSRHSWERVAARVAVVCEESVREYGSPAD